MIEQPQSESDSEIFRDKQRVMFRNPYDIYVEISIETERMEGKLAEKLYSREKMWEPEERKGREDTYFLPSK